MHYYSKHLFLCINQKTAGKTCCANTGGEPFFDYLKAECRRLGIDGEGKVRVSKSGCLGRCSLGPSLVIYPEGVWYSYRSFADLDEIIATHLMQGGIVSRLIMQSAIGT